jgi:glycosyltransferase involved in cell wall biosynthesis
VLLGRISHDEVLKNLEEADFTVLMRSETQRYARAGFPTKVVESLASATPVICNITSDLGNYLVDGENSMIVSGCTAESFAITLKRILALSQVEKAAMKISARKTAEKNFNYLLYKEEFEKLL